MTNEAGIVDKNHSGWHLKLHWEAWALTGVFQLVVHGPPTSVSLEYLCKWKFLGSVLEFYTSKSLCLGDRNQHFKQTLQAIPMKHIIRKLGKTEKTMKKFFNLRCTWESTSSHRLQRRGRISNWILRLACDVMKLPCSKEILACNVRWKLCSLALFMTFARVSTFAKENVCQK